MLTELTVRIYKQIVKLYPVAYRDDYEDEMVDTLQLMLQDADELSQKLTIISRTINDFLRSLVSLKVEAFETANLDTPSYVRSSSKYSISLILPFFIVCAYNWLNNYLLHLSAASESWESKTWSIYCIVLPVIAGAIISLTGAFNILENFKSKHLHIRSWLLLGIPALLLVAMILM